MSDMISRDVVLAKIHWLSSADWTKAERRAADAISEAIRAIPAADRIEKLLEQRDEARRDAVEAETYVGELETKLAKTRTFIYELWDSQGHDASELRDLTDCLDSSPQPNDKLRQMYADYRKAISDGRLKVVPTDAALRAKVTRLEGALQDIDALDPEGRIGDCSVNAISGLVLRMGQIARAALNDGGKDG